MASWLIHKAREKAEMALLRRKQATSARLRQIFRERHDIDVGLYSYGCFDQWRMPGPIRVGRWCSIASSVRSAPINHPLDAVTTHPALYDRAFGVVDRSITWDTPLVIEDDVWIGHNAIILPGCKFVGRGSVIGAGSIVTRDVAPYSIMAGNPAKLIRRRFSDDLIAAIEASRWWELDAPALRTIQREDPDALHHASIEGLARIAARRKAAGDAA